VAKKWQRRGKKVANEKEKEKEKKKKKGQIQKRNERERKSTFLFFTALTLATLDCVD